MSPAAQQEFNRLMDACKSTSIRQPRTLSEMFEAANAQGWTWFVKGDTEWRKDRDTGRWYTGKRNYKPAPVFANHGASCIRPNDRD